MSKGIPKETKRDSSEKEKEKIPITFNRDQLSAVDAYRGILGNTKAEIIRNIVINWLLEHRS